MMADMVSVVESAVQASAASAADLVPPPLPPPGSSGGAQVLPSGEEVKSLRGRVEQLKQLVADLRVVMDQNVGMNERIVILDQERDDWRQEMGAIKEQADSILFTTSGTAEDKVTECKEFLSTLSSKLLELLSEKVVAPVESGAGPQDGDKEGGGGANTHTLGENSLDWSESQYSKEQVARSRDIQHIEENLLRKVEEIRRATEENGQMVSVVEQQRREVDALQQDIDRMEGEREQLVRKLHSTAAGSEASGAPNRLKLASAGGGGGADPKLKKMIEDKEQQLTALRKRLGEQSKLLRLKEQNDIKIQHLRKEIVNMKQAKVKLVKQMREESEKFRVFKVENEKDAKDRKTQAEIVRLERKNELQENKLKRKMEEASAAQKRLEEALERQKAAQDTSNERTITDASGERIQEWLLQEIEIKTSTEECKQHVQSMTEEREVLVRRQRALDSQLAEPTSKKAALSMCDDDETPQESPSEATNKLIAERERVRRSIALKNDQIVDLEKTIPAADESDKQNKWTNLTNLQEAKYAADYLMAQVVDSKMEAIVSGQQLADVREDLRGKSEECEALQSNVEEVRAECEERITQLTQQHDDKITPPKYYYYESCEFDHCQWH